MDGKSSQAGRVSPQWIEHADASRWASAIAGVTADALRVDLAVGDSARLLVSGGTTPAPVYRELTLHGLDWGRVRVALVDERWLPPGDADSNAELVRESLLDGPAAAARFEPILMADRNLDEAVRAANRLSRPASIALLGMGPDGHTASLFPGAPSLAQALVASDDYVSFDAAGCPGAGAWPLRISITPAGLAKARHRLLLVRGEAKRRLLERAISGDDVSELPVRVLFSLPGNPLQIHWCP
ncbi:MAG: 6-phosphogluconolactonase [Gammaproteobacteria bacterium]|nr:6-phosphogluconolactonase [Gammaproteobacteria bacterium]